MGCGASRTPGATVEPESAAPAAAQAGPAPSVSGSASDIGEHDVMISYAHKDSKAMNLVRDALESAGLTVWVDKTGIAVGTNWMARIGEAIVNSKCVVFLLSTRSVGSRYCNDEVSLAYVSDKPIVPLMLEPYDVLSSVMDPGMRLTIASMQWVDMSALAPDTPDPSPDELEQMRSQIQTAVQNATQEQVEFEPGKRVDEKARKSMAVHDSMQDSRRSEGATRRTFWERSFPDADEVPWMQFREAFESEYATELERVFPDAETRNTLMRLIRREVFNIPETETSEVMATRADFDFFRGPATKAVFFKQVTDLAVVDVSLNTVFNVDSTVRLTAIENLAKHSAHPRILDALTDLVKFDKDANVRAVASICLSRAQRNAKDVDDAVATAIEDALLGAVQDPDRLVRQAVILALGSLQCHRAIPAIADRWRNDAISVVRDAAEAALNNMDHPEAAKQLQVTRVIAEEIKKLGARTIPV